VKYNGEYVEKVCYGYSHIPSVICLDNSLDYFHVQFDNYLIIEDYAKLILLDNLNHLPHLMIPPQELNIGKLLHSNDYEEFERIYFHPSLHSFKDAVLVLVDIYETRTKLDEESDISPMIITKNLYEIHYFDQSDSLKKVNMSRDIFIKFTDFLKTRNPKIYSLERLLNVFKFNYTRYNPPLLGGGLFTLDSQVESDDDDENEEGEDILQYADGEFTFSMKSFIDKRELDVEKWPREFLERVLQKFNYTLRDDEYIDNLGKRHFIHRKYIPKSIELTGLNELQILWINVLNEQRTYMLGAEFQKSIRNDEELEMEVNQIEEDLRVTRLFRDVKPVTRANQKYKSWLITFFRYNKEQIKEKIVNLIADGYHDLHAVHVLFTLVQCKKTHNWHCFLYLHLDDQIRLGTLWNWWGQGNQFRGINKNMRIAPKILYKCICEDDDPLYTFPDPFFPPYAGGKNSSRNEASAQRILSLIDQITPEMTKEQIIRLDPTIALHSTKVLCDLQFEKNFEEMRTYDGDLRERCLWLYRPPGSGKSLFAHTLSNHVYTKDPTNKWWCGYQPFKHEIFLLEDMPDISKGASSSEKVQQLKVWSDRFNYKVEVKSGSQVLNPNKFTLIVTSNYSIDNCLSDNTEDTDALKRRFFVVNLDETNCVQLDEEKKPLLDDFMDSMAVL
jgi:hypothetical protein